VVDRVPHIPFNPLEKLCGHVLTQGLMIRAACDGLYFQTNDQKINDPH